MEKNRYACSYIFSFYDLAFICAVFLPLCDFLYDSVSLCEHDLPFPVRADGRVSRRRRHGIFPGWRFSR